MVFRSRIFEFVSLHFAAQSGAQINLQFIGDGQRVTEDIRQFFANGHELLRVLANGARRFRGDPLEVLHQFGGFDR